MASSHTADPPAEPQAPPQPFDPSEPFVSVPSVSVKALQSPVTALTLPSALALHGMEDASAHLSVAPTVQLVTDEWERAVETLYLSLRQHNVCCLKLPDIMAKGNQELMRRTCQDVLTSSAAGGSAATPVVRQSPGRSSCSLRLGATSLQQFPDSVQRLAPVAFACLENTAKTALSSMCRSCHVRLRCDTFQPIMDDFPLPPGSVSSSELTVAKHKASLAGPRAATPWSLQGHKEGCRHPGLITLLCQHSDDARREGMHRLQVANAAGQWQSVDIRPNEVAVLIGHTAETASAGVLTAASSRVVGGVGAAAQSTILEFQLNARRDAVVDFHPALRSAGHPISSQYRSPMQLSTLMAQFDAVMTPGPRMSLGGSTPGPVVEISALRNVPARVSLRSKRLSLRGSTCSPARKLRRASAPQELPEARLPAEDGAADGGNATERMCITIDGQGRRKSDFIRLSVLGSDGSEILFQLHPTTELSRLFEVYSGISGLPLTEVKFELAGQRLLGSDTARSRNIQSGMAMNVLPTLQPKPQEPLKAEEDVLPDHDPTGEQAASLQCSEHMEA